MEITIRRKAFGGWRTEMEKMVNNKNARAAYRKLEKRVEEENEKAGEKKWIIDCIDYETGEIIWHN